MQVKDDNGGQPGNLIATYEFDGVNRRIQKVVEGSPDVTYDYYFNTNWQMLEVRKDSDTDPYKQYVWSLRYVDAPVLRDYDADTDGTSVRHYYLNDANMNVTTLVDTGGDAVERCEYDPYGKVTFYDGGWGNPSSTSSYANVVLYCGYRLDTESGLYHVRRRMYHPTLGRWLQRDPLGYAGGMSLYEYVMSSPLRGIDPYGTSIESVLSVVQTAQDIYSAGQSARAIWEYIKWIPKGRALGALAKLDAKHAGYLYYEANGGWVTGLRPLIWDKLNKALWWLDSNDFSEVAPRTGPLTRGVAHYRNWWWDKHMFISSGPLDPTYVFHEAIHAYNDWVDKYEGRNEQEGIAYAAGHMEAGLGRLRFIEDLLRSASRSANPLRGQAQILERWQGLWGVRREDNRGWEQAVAIGWPASGTEAGRVTEQHVRWVNSHLGFKIRCSEIAPLYNAHPGAAKACVEFHCTPNARPTKSGRVVAAPSSILPDTAR